jgi:hypothetical protein
MFSQPGVFYFNQPDTVYDKTNWSIDLEKIQKLKQHQLVVADFSHEHYGNDIIYNTHDVLKSHDVNFLLLSHHPGDHLKIPQLLFYPHYYHWARQQFSNQVIDISKIKKQHNISCLNGEPRPHRIYNFLTLNKKSYFNDLLFSIHRNSVDLSVTARADDVALSNDMLSEWDTVYPKLSKKTESAKTLTLSRLDSYLQDPAYIDSYINLVTETTVTPKLFVTEKTWKPVAAGQLFLVIGNPGTIDYLRTQGVDVFDDIIDHKYYDNEHNWQSRILKIHELIEDLITQDLYAINQATQERRQQNRTRFFAGAFDQTYQNKIQECINMLN